MKRVAIPNILNFHLIVSLNFFCISICFLSESESCILSDSSYFFSVDACFWMDAALASALVGLVVTVAFLSLVVVEAFAVDVAGAVAAGLLTLDVSLLVVAFYWLVVACCLLPAAKVDYCGTFVLVLVLVAEGLTCVAGFVLLATLVGC